MQLENNQMNFFLTIGILGTLSLMGLIWSIYQVIKQDRDLRAWRKALKRGDMVTVDKFNDKQEVWANQDNIITLRMHGPDFWFYNVNITQVYPLENEIEYEIIHE